MNYKIIHRMMAMRVATLIFVGKNYDWIIFNDLLRSYIYR